jgi:Transposase, Mutator family
MSVTGPPGRRNVYQALIEAELTDTIGAALHERTESRINLRNGHRTRILSTTAGDRAPSSSASAARSRSRPTNDVNRAAGLGRSASSGGAAGSAVREGAARFGSWRSIACSSARNGAGAGGGAAAALQRVGE